MNTDPYYSAENPLQLGKDFLPRFEQRPKGPTVNRPGREAGIRLGKKNEHRRCGTLLCAGPLDLPLHVNSRSTSSRAWLLPAGSSSLISNLIATRTLRGVEVSARSASLRWGL